MDIRPINSRCGLLPRAHGSALFTRGETQVQFIILCLMLSVVFACKFIKSCHHVKTRIALLLSRVTTCMAVLKHNIHSVTS